MMQPLLQVNNLKKYFATTRGLWGSRGGDVRAVDGVSLAIREGETLGLVGESGCGKSTLGRTIMRLIEPSGGEILYRGRDITKLGGRDLRSVRREMQMIFQDPYSSLNPRQKVRQIVGAPLEVHKLGTREERHHRVEELLENVGLHSAYADRYPHQFSGGMRQRIGIARAIASNPSFLVADEPVSALDVSVQVQILNLLKDLQDQLGLTMLFIAHDVSVVQYVSHRVALMYLGRLVELANRDAIYSSPKHPYAQALMSAVPVLDPDGRHDRRILEGDVPSPIDPPTGCRFHPRCWIAEKRCAEVEPEFREVEENHFVACHLAE